MKSRGWWIGLHVDTAKNRPGPGNTLTELPLMAGEGCYCVVPPTTPVLGLNEIVAELWR